MSQMIVTCIMLSWVRIQAGFLIVGGLYCCWTTALPLCGNTKAFIHLPCLWKQIVYQGANMALRIQW